MIHAKAGRQPNSDRALICDTSLQYFRTKGFGKHLKPFVMSRTLASVGKSDKVGLPQNIGNFKGVKLTLKKQAENTQVKLNMKEDTWLLRAFGCRSVAELKLQLLDTNDTADLDCTNGIEARVPNHIIIDATSYRSIVNHSIMDCEKKLKAVRDCFVGVSFLQ